MLPCDAVAETAVPDSAPADLAGPAKAPAAATVAAASSGRVNREAVLIIVSPISCLPLSSAASVGPSAQNALKTMGSPRFRLLGPLEIDGGGPLGGPKQRTLLAQLLLHANETVPRVRLIDELWPDEPPETAAHAIQVYVSQLRKALPPGARIVTEGSSYKLEIDEEEVDALRLERLLERGRRLLRDGDPRGAA